MSKPRNYSWCLHYEHRTERGLGFEGLAVLPLPRLRQGLGDK